MEACTGCQRLSKQLIDQQHEARRTVEEVLVLRRAQYDCASMANDIQAYQQCVEAQRAELARASPVKDATIGLHELLGQLSMYQRKHEEQGKTRLNEKIHQLKEEVHQLHLKCNALSAEYPDRVPIANAVVQQERIVALEEQAAAHTALQKKLEAERDVARAEKDRLLVCVDEQRRHVSALASHPGSLDTDAGVVSLLESARQRAVTEVQSMYAEHMAVQQVQMAAMFADLEIAKEQLLEKDNAEKQRRDEDVEVMREVVEKLRHDLAVSERALKEALEQTHQACGEARAVKSRLVELEDLIATLTRREAKYVDEIAAHLLEREESAQRMRSVVQRHLTEHMDQQRALNGVREHRVVLQRELCKVSVDKQMLEAKLHEMEAQLAFGNKMAVAMEELQQVFVKHGFISEAATEKAATEKAEHTAKMLELQCTREDVQAPATPKNKKKNKKAVK